MRATVPFGKGAGDGHVLPRLVWRIVAGNLALFGAALLATWLIPLAGLGAAVAVVGVLMWSLTRRAASDEEAQTS